MFVLKSVCFSVVEMSVHRLCMGVSLRTALLVFFLFSYNIRAIKQKATGVATLLK